MYLFSVPFSIPFDVDIYSILVHIPVVVVDIPSMFCDVNSFLWVLLFGVDTFDDIRWWYSVFTDDDVDSTSIVPVLMRWHSIH